jgi:hypothetical protein
LKHDQSKQRTDAELDALRALCDQLQAREPRMALCQALANYQFTEPDRQIVFESVRELLNRNALSTSALIVHLNNRGFPDINLEVYFAPGVPGAGDALAGMREFLSRSV